MKKKVLFKSKENRKPFVEFVPYNANFFSESPEVFNNPDDDYATISVITHYNEFFINGDVDTKPKYFIRHTNNDSTRFVGIIDFNDDFLQPQIGGHTEDLEACHKDDAFVKHQQVDDTHYGYSSFNGEMKLIVDETSIEFKEGNVLEGKGTFFPYAVVDHNNIWNDIACIYQSYVFEGTYLGQSVKGVGRYSRSFRPSSDDHPYELLGYIDNELVGVREDGRREMTIIHMDSTGKVFAFYLLDGEEPVVSDEVEMETEWYRLPYMDDGTCIYKEVTYRFGGKEIHFKGKWGTKGFTEKPRFDKNGQSQVFGTWYEGKEEYKHTLYQTFNENQECYDYKLKEMGFDVID